MAGQRRGARHEHGRDGGGAGGLTAGGRGPPRGGGGGRELLRRVTADLAANGLVDFSLRRAARAAGTTHKVLLYYFDSADDLLAQAMFQLREHCSTKARSDIGTGL